MPPLLDKSIHDKNTYRYVKTCEKSASVTLSNQANYTTNISNIKIYVLTVI